MYVAHTSQAAAQHSVQPTSGSPRVFWQFATPQQDSVFESRPYPAHLRLTRAVGRTSERKTIESRKGESYYRTKNLHYGRLRLSW